MNRYSYRARNQIGVLVQGEMEAESEEELGKTFASQGLMPVAVKNLSKGFNFNMKINLTPPVKQEEVLVLTRQFYTLFKAGMSMESIIGTLLRQTTNKRMIEVLQLVRSRISSGESLAKAFSGFPDVFTELYVSMLAAGEEAGILEEVLKNVAELTEKELQIKGSIKSATMYPKIVIFVLAGAMMVIMTFVVPKFASFFAHYKAELPLPTRILMAFSHFTVNYWYILLISLGVLVFIYKRYAATQRGKLRIGKLRFKTPVFGLLNIKIANSRFCHILGALYRSGLPITRCLEITGRTIDNAAFEREVNILQDSVMKGRSLAEGMGQCHYFTPIIVDATAVGEKTGSLDEMLESMGNHYDLEVQHTIKNLTTLLEPFLLFFLFGMVTVFALAIFLPIWNISKAVTGSH